LAVNSAKDFDIKNLTSFKTGGKIKEVFFPETIEDFLLPEMPNSQYVFGNLSNTLVSSFGCNKKIILTTKMNTVKIEGTRIIANCGVKGPKLAQIACENELSGIEFMIGFPGSIGGEVYMNASARAQAISDTLIYVTCLDANGKIVKFSKDEMDFEYRSSRCKKDKLTVLQAEFELTKTPKEEIQSKMNENLAFRKAHQPSLALPNCGSIFKNPPGESAGRLLESIGAKTLKSGGARVWENHANFIVNDQNGTSTDILKLMHQMQTKVTEKYNIKLEPEIVFLNGENKEENELWEILNKK